MYYSSSLEYIIGNSYLNHSYSSINYFSKNVDDTPACENASPARVHLYGFERESPMIFETQYRGKTFAPQYKNQQQYEQQYFTHHSFTPDIFLNKQRPRGRFVVDNREVRSIAKETFKLMMKEKMPENISINVLPFEEFKAIHSRFGLWNDGILGFSLNGLKKKIFVRENHLNSLVLIIGHEIGHVLTETLPNNQDEEAKAFAFSVEWAKTIKNHNIANLGLNIKDELDFQPARNGLHDIAFAFVDFMVKKGVKASEVHRDLVKQYVSVFDRVY